MTQPKPVMSKGRLEAFSDGVIAVIITIIVLEMKAPHGDEPAALLPLIPVFMSYVLSFLYVGIYWNNHHHMFHATQRISGAVMWANLHLLFWLSLIPFVTAWMGENHFAAMPTALYGVILFFAAVAYTILQSVLVATEGQDSLLKAAIGKDFKGKLSMVAYASAIGLAFMWQWLAGLIYLLVALMSLIPDRRIERALEGAVASRESR
jgi:uncharacterized membrane protein